MTFPKLFQLIVSLLDLNIYCAVNHKLHVCVFQSDYNTPIHYTTVAQYRSYADDLCNFNLREFQSWGISSANQSTSNFDYIAFGFLTF